MTAPPEVQSLPDVFWFVLAIGVWGGAAIVLATVIATEGPAIYRAARQWFVNFFKCESRSPNEIGRSVVKDPGNLGAQKSALASGNLADSLPRRTALLDRVALTGLVQAGDSNLVRMQEWRTRTR